MRERDTMPRRHVMTNPKRPPPSPKASAAGETDLEGDADLGGDAGPEGGAEPEDEPLDDKEPFDDKEPPLEAETADRPPRPAARASAAARGDRALAPLPPGVDLVPSQVRDPVARFLAEIRRYPRLSEEDERRLGRAVREGGDMDAARRLVVHNLRLVVAIAHQYRRAWTNILDLFQEGSVGLMEAVKRWEPMLGPRFGSYAAYWIRAYVLKFLMTNSRLIHVGNTRAGRKLFYRLERERQKLMATGFDPTPKLLAANLDVDERELIEVSRHLDSREVSFEPRTGDSDEGYALSERIPTEQDSPEERAATSEMSGTLHEVMADFLGSLREDRERAVWQEHLAAEEPVSLGEIGARFGVSKQRMGQIADKLKKQFRERIVARMGPAIRTDWLGEGD
jgi:RNA polymerase sigma-32 factor